MISKTLYIILFSFMVVVTGGYAQSYTKQQLDDMLTNIQSLGDSLPLTVLVKSEESYRFSEQLGYDKGIVASSIFMSKALLDTNQYYQVLEQNSKVEKRALKIDDYQALSEIYRLNGMSYVGLGLFDQGALEFQKSLDCTNKITDSDAAYKHKGLAYKDLALGYYKSGKKLDSVLKYFILSHNYFAKIKDPKTRIVNLTLANNNIGYCFLEMKQYNPASTYLINAANLLEQENYTTARLYTYLNLGRVKSEQNQFSDAICYLEESLLLAKKLKKNEILCDVYLNLLKTYKKNGDRSKEEYYYDKYLFLSDSLQKVQKTSSIKAIKDLLDQKDDKDVELKRNWLIGLIVVALFSFLLVYRAVRIYLFKIKEKLIVAEKKEVLQHKQLFLSKAIEADKISLAELVELAKNNDAQFISAFKKVQADFYCRFIEKFPELTEEEIKVCAFLRLGFHVKDIAIYTNATVRSVESRIYRIRRKTALQLKDDISLWILSF